MKKRKEKKDTVWKDLHKGKLERKGELQLDIEDTDLGFNGGGGLEMTPLKVWKQMECL